MTGAGTQYTYYQLEFVTKLPRENPDGRVIFIPVSTFYVKKNEITKKRHLGAELTKDLAEKLAVMYADKNPVIREDIGHTTEFTEPLKTTLVDVGEEAAPAPQKPECARVLEEAVRGAMERMTRRDVMQVICDVLLQESKT